VRPRDLLVLLSAVALLTSCSRRLAFALQDYVPLNYGITAGPETPKQDWDELFTKLNATEAAAHGEAKSPSAIFNQLVFTVGENKRYIDPWIELIPDEYGLGIIKASIAILLNVSVPTLTRK
jgi:hypothetical protein